MGLYRKLYLAKKQREKYYKITTLTEGKIVIAERALYDATTDKEALFTYLAVLMWRETSCSQGLDVERKEKVC